VAEPSETTEQVHVLAYRERRVQAQLLRRQTDQCTYPVGMLRHVEPADHRAPRVGPGQPGDDLDECRLSSAVVTNQPDDLASVDLQIEAVQRNHVAIAFL
jgi:hypothetical protein